MNSAILLASSVIPPCLKINKARRSRLIRPANKDEFAPNRNLIILDLKDLRREYAGISQRRTQLLQRRHSARVPEIDQMFRLTLVHNDVYSCSTGGRLSS